MPESTRIHERASFSARFFRVQRLFVDKGRYYGQRDQVKHGFVGGAIKQKGGSAVENSSGAVHFWGNVRRCSSFRCVIERGGKKRREGAARRAFFKAQPLKMRRRNGTGKRGFAFSRSVAPCRLRRRGARPPLSVSFCHRVSSRPTFQNYTIREN